MLKMLAFDDKDVWGGVWQRAVLRLARKVHGAPSITTGVLMSTLPK